MSARHVFPGSVLVAVSFLTAGVAGAADLTGRISAGIVVDDPWAVVTGLASEPRLEDDDIFFVAWTVAPDGSGETTIIEAIRATGALPWLKVVLTTPAPLVDHLGALETELAGLAELARIAGDDLVIQAEWEPASGSATAKDRGYFIKRTAVAVTGAATKAAFTVGPLPLDPVELEALYAEEVAAYLDLVALAPGEGIEAAIASLSILDPGKPVVLDAVPWPTAPSAPLAEIAASAATGVAVTLIEAPSAVVDNLVELKVAARELRGGLVHDPYTDPTGAGRAWAFVREDLGLRVVAERAAGERRLRLVFSDPLLRLPEIVDLATGEVRPATGVRRASDFVVVVDEAPDVVLIRLHRPSAAELEGFDEEIEVGGGRQMPVEEILRRLQAFKDDQDRRLSHYQAKRDFHLRYQGQQGSIEASYAGEFFFRDGTFDWVWSEFYIGGVKWRSRKMPKVPLIQPEKAASLPIDIEFSKYYVFRLRGTEVVDGRDCWVLDFKPIEAAPGRSLYQGTVWVDREIYAQVRTRAIQVGLEGDVLSNEETYHFSPIDEAGRPAPWSRESFVLPLRISGQQVFSILNATFPVEIENRFTEIRINAEEFDTNRSAALASDATMLRDTEDGLRYLPKDKSGQRVVEEDFDSSRLFLVGGVFWDESVEYPLPGVGVNYLDLDFMDSGAQLNVLFAGIFLSANIADPDFLGSRWNAGANLTGLFFKRHDELYREGAIVPEEDVRRRSGTFNLFVGRPMAKFLSLELALRLRHEDYSRADETADEFILPQDTLTTVFEASVDYNRSGYRVSLAGDLNSRLNWEYWGLPGNTDYSPDQKDYQRWQFTVAKTWWLPKFRKIGVVFEHLDSPDTDRFSGYDFGLFGDSAVAGYQSGLVRAEKANGVHVTAGVNYLDLIRITLQADAVWATNRAAGLDNELLGGVGVGGTVTLPWQLIMNFDAGYALVGPGRGNIALRIFFLKLFPGS